MTATATPISSAKDKDAEYVLRRLAIIEECDAAEESNSQRRRAARLEAGRRLIEVHKRVRDNNVSRTRGFKGWLDDAAIPRRTAYDLMRDAGFSETQLTARRSHEARRKRAARSEEPTAADFVQPEPTPREHFDGLFHDASALLYQVRLFLETVVPKMVEAPKYQSELATMNGYATDILNHLKRLSK